MLLHSPLDDLFSCFFSLSTQVTNTWSLLCKFPAALSSAVQLSGRRDEEGSRILLSEWNDAINGVWFPKDSDVVLDAAEKYLSDYFILYMQGKGKRFVPVLVPCDLKAPITLMLSMRDSVGITEKNIFLFASRASISHCSGWTAVSNICKAAGVGKINATRNRHRLSTLYAALHMSDTDKEVFMNHIGHSEKVDVQNYQCPPAIRDVNVMGKVLSHIDQGTCLNVINKIIAGLLFVTSLILVWLCYKDCLALVDR